MESKQNKTTKVKTMLNEGKSVTDIAKAVPCNKALVYMVRKEHFPEMGRKYAKRKKAKANKPSPEAAAKIKEWSSKKVNMQRIDGAIEKVRLAAAEVSKKFFEDTAVNHPAHYTAGGIEVYDFIKAKCLGYELGNVVKYVSRAEYKANKLQDLQKARWYLDAAIKKEGGV
jgi:hypothetical protein